jgi:hypothetical protein
MTYDTSIRYRDVPLVSLRRTTSNATPGIGGGPRTLSYNTLNKTENNVLILSDAEVGVCTIKPIKPSSNTVFLTYLHTTYVSFIHIIPYIGRLLRAYHILH